MQCAPDPYEVFLSIFDLETEAQQQLRHPINYYDTQSIITIFLDLLFDYQVVN